MTPAFHTLSVLLEAPYYTFGTLDVNTQSIWIVCHGIGQRAPYFMRKFEGMLQPHQFLIVPQGLSRYYLHGKYDRVGASWMTKEYREMEIRNQWIYLDSLVKKELGTPTWEPYEVNLLGFSQGVATIARWAIGQRIPFKRLILWAGGFPHEMRETLTDKLSPEAEVWAVYGNEDPFLKEEQVTKEMDRLNSLFGRHLNTHIFEGAHELNKEVLKELFFIH